MIVLRIVLSFSLSSIEYVVFYSPKPNDFKFIIKLFEKVAATWIIIIMVKSHLLQIFYVKFLL